MLKTLKILSTIFIIFTGPHLKAQDQYYVKLNRDTVYGKLNINTYRDNSLYMRFKTTDGESFRIYPQSSIAAYHSEEYDYRSVLFNDKKVFMQLLHEGDLSFYNYTRESISGSVITTQVAVKYNGEAIEIPNFGFKKAMAEFVSDCPELQNEILDKTYRSNDLKEISEAYEGCPGKQRMETVNNEINTPELAQIETFRQDVKGDSTLDNKNNILDLLKDLERRVKASEDVPEYIWNALFSMIKDNNEIEEKALDLKLKISGQ